MPRPPEITTLAEVRSGRSDCETFSDTKDDRPASIWSALRLTASVVAEPPVVGAFSKAVDRVSSSYPTSHHHKRRGKSNQLRGKEWGAGGRVYLDWVAHAHSGDCIAGIHGALEGVLVHDLFTNSQRSVLSACFVFATEVIHTS